MKLLWVALSIPVVYAQLVPNRYIVELQAEPARSPQGQQSRLRRQLATRGARVLTATQTVANTLTVEIPDADARALASLPGVARVHPVRLARPALDRALPLHQVPQAWAAIGGSANAGAGIKIAIIDSGIAQDHPAFQDPSLAMPPGFPLANQARDLAWTNNKVIVARNYVAYANPQDAFGHGTAVAMEAAGVTNSGPLGVITGVAPKAWLGNYKVFQDDNPFGEDTVLQAIEDAVNDGMDVINLSLGVSLAGRTGDDVLVAAVERASALGVVVCVAAGNLGSAPNTIASPATAPSAIAVGATYSDRVFAPGIVQRNGAAAYYAIPASGRASLAPIAAPVIDVAAFDPGGEACVPLAASLAGAIALIVRSPQTGQACSFADKLNNAQNAGAAAAIVYMNADSPSLVAIDARSSTLPAVSVDYMSGLDIKAHLSDSFTLQLTSSPFPQNPNVIAPFSSRGPSVDAAIKPDVVATGTFVYTATQKTNPNSVLYGATGYIKEADGTSFAAPLAAGAAALLKAARPGLTAAQYRSLLVNSAAPIRFPVQSAGAGVLNVNAALQNTIAVSPVSLSFSGAATDLTITNLGQAGDTFTISIAPDAPVRPASTTVRLAAGASEQVPMHLTTSVLAPGEYQGYLHIQGAQSAIDTVVPYWYGVPDGVPKSVTELAGPDVAAPGSLQDIFFRVTDASGLPIPSAPATVRPIGALGSVLRVTTEDSLSAFHAVVLLDRQDGPNLFEIAAGPVRRQVTILGQSR
jgi:minor extracellular serine protease Vpr